MLNTIKQNKKAVLAFLLALVMLIGIIPFTATEVQAVTIPVGDITTNDSFGNGDTWQDGDQIKIERTVGYGSDYYTYTASVDENGITTWALDKKLYWDGKEEHILAAFYPAAGQDDYRSFELPEDQSTLEKLKLADCMNAVWVGNPTTDPIKFQMKHRLSMVTVNYEFASEFTNATVDNVKVIPSDPFVMFDAEDGGKMDEPYGVFGTTIDAYHDADNKTIQAIVIPCTYPEGQLFMTLEVNGEELQVKMPEAKTLEEGTHYTFDLKVGKDKVTIEQVSVNGNDPSVPFGDGWRSDTEEDLGAVSITDTQDEGKTAWDDGDQIIATLTSQRYGEQTAMLTFSGSDGTWSTDESFSYLENETPTVKAIYAPSNILGTGEYIEFDCELNGAELTVKLENAKRNYSRLRIVGLPNKTLTVTTTEFTPAGATSAATAPYTLTTDENGNAFLYGTFAEGATISVKQGDVVLKEYAFTANKHPGGTEHGKSYVLDAVPVIDLSQYSDGDTINITQDSVIVGDGNEYNISVNIAEDAIVTFDVGASGVKLGGQITVADGKTLTLLVAGDAEHTVNGGISLGNGSNVIIEGDLTKENNKLTVTATGGNAGIGANNGVTAGDITIRNARVDATGSGSTDGSGAAIGTSDASMGNILIDNSIVIAAGGYYNSDDFMEISHAAAIGMGYYGGTIGNITLKNSEITASNNGDGLASVIGAGSQNKEGDNNAGTLGDIIITNTDLNLSMVISNKNTYAAIIGPGMGYSYAWTNMGKIIFTDVTQTELDEMIANWLPSDFNEWGAYALGRGYDGSAYKKETFGGVWVSDGNGGTVQIGNENGYYCLNEAIQ